MIFSYKLWCRLVIQDIENSQISLAKEIHVKSKLHITIAIHSPFIPNPPQKIIKSPNYYFNSHAMCIIITMAGTTTTTALDQQRLPLPLLSWYLLSHPRLWQICQCIFIFLVSLYYWNFDGLIWVSGREKCCWGVTASRCFRLEWHDPGSVWLPGAG